MKYQVLYNQDGNILSFADAAEDLKDDDGNPVAFGPVTSDGQETSIIEIKAAKTDYGLTLIDQYRVKITGKAACLCKLRAKK